MTALTEYDRLESTGLWRDGPDVQRREVVVSLGEATLTLTGPGHLAIAHWSLPAIIRLNPGQTPAIFAPGSGAAETLEIEDPEMLGALDKVIGVLAKRKARPGRLRLAIIVGTLALVGGLSWTELPRTLLNYTLTVVPDPKRVEIGEALQAALIRITGSPCHAPEADRALARLETKLSPGRGGRYVVLPDGVGKARAIPGHVTLIDRALVEDYDDPAVLAGYLLSEGLTRETLDPLDPLLRHAGFWATFRLYTRGDLPPAAIEEYAETLLRSPLQRHAPQALLPRFEAAGVPSAPFAYDLDPTGETTLPLIEADPYPHGATDPVLADGAWVALQGVCGN